MQVPRGSIWDGMRASALSRLAARLAARSESVAVCETSAGGLVAAALLSQSGASAWFKGGVVAYTKSSKSELLGMDPERVPPTATEAHALTLARAVRARLGSEWAVGETGVAGPAANSRGVAPGVCGVAVVGPGIELAATLWPDDSLGAADAYGQAPQVSRRDAMELFSQRALSLLCDAVDAADGGSKGSE